MAPSTVITQECRMNKNENSIVHLNGLLNDFPLATKIKIVQKVDD